MSMSMNGEFIDYYELLEVSYSSTGAEIRASFLKLAKSLHPDAGGSTEQMQELNDAYTTLSDDTKRAAYNKMYNLGRDETNHLDLREESVPATDTTVSTGLEDDFVDQVFSEYYNKEKPKKKPWFKS